MTWNEGLNFCPRWVFSHPGEQPLLNVLPCWSWRSCANAGLHAELYCFSADSAAIIVGQRITRYCSCRPADEFTREIEHHSELLKKTSSRQRSNIMAVIARNPPSLPLNASEPRMILALSIFFMVLTTIAIALRVYSRKLKRQAFIVEDYLIFCALVRDSLCAIRAFTFLINPNRSFSIFIPC